MMDNKNKVLDDGASKSSPRTKPKKSNTTSGKRRGSFTSAIEARKSSSPRKINNNNNNNNGEKSSASRKKSKKRVSSCKTKKTKNENENNNIKITSNNKGTVEMRSEQAMIHDGSQSNGGGGASVVGATSIDFDDVGLRWDDACEDPVDEMRRIEAYKANRRLRYTKANSMKIAALTLQDRKF